MLSEINYGQCKNELKNLGISDITTKTTLKWK